MTIQSNTSLDLNVMGLNSGTSMDGIDVVLCNFKQESYDSPLYLTVLKCDEMDMPNDLKTNVLRIIKENPSSPEEISQVSTLLGKAFADTAFNFCLKHEITTESIDIIGSHGQTVWYVPTVNKRNDTRSVMTLGETCYISQKMKTTVVSAFRVSEQSVG